MSRQAKYRAKQAELGLTQVTFWVKREHLAELRRFVASLGVTSDTPQPEPGVTSDTVTSDLPRTVEELLAQRRRPGKRAASVTSDDRKAKAAALQAKRAEQFASLATRFDVRNEAGKAFEARIISWKPVGNRVGDFGTGYPAHVVVEVLARIGDRFLPITIWDRPGRIESKPDGYEPVATLKEREAVLRRAMKAAHSDTGENPDPVAFQAAKEALDALRGR
jgi:hypothetical protein